MIRAYISIPVYAVTGAGFCHLFGLFSYGVKDYLVLVGLAIRRLSHRPSMGIAWRKK
jgi:hypothetical protein